jgi:hypothetical protein
MSYEYVYYNALTNNFDQQTDETYSHEANLVFNEMRDSPIIQDCEKYDMAIESFKLYLKTLPVIIPTIKYNELNENSRETIYKITVEVHYQNMLYSYSEHVEFLNQDKTISLPTMRNGYADHSTGFYNIYNYDWFIVLVIMF